MPSQVSMPLGEESSSRSIRTCSKCVFGRLADRGSPKDSNKEQWIRVTSFGCVAGLFLFVTGTFSKGYIHSKLQSFPTDR